VKNAPNKSAAKRAIGRGIEQLPAWLFLRNITIVYSNKGSGMDNCPYRLHIL
jgi:hypothetical protein